MNTKCVELTKTTFGGRLSTNVRRVVMLVKKTVAQWYQNSRSRKELTSMNTHELKDIGISRHQAIEEAAKPFWRTRPSGE